MLIINFEIFFIFLLSLYPHLSENSNKKAEIISADYLVLFFDREWQKNTFTHFEIDEEFHWPDN
jgi:hypothetical protein